MLITSLTITDYKRVRTVEITPPADRHLILIGGKNRQGKSSTLDALTAAFGGAKAIAADPVRHGAGAAAIYVELDGGKLTIDRTIDAAGKTTIDVRDAQGAVRRPQELLDKLVGARFLDPLAFLRLAAKDQRAQLMKLIPEAARIEELEAKRRRAFDRRTELGRDLARAKGELERLPEQPVTQAIDIAALTSEQRAFGEQQRAGEQVAAAAKAAELELANANSRLSGVLTQIEDLRRALASLEARMPELQGEVDRKIAAAQAAMVALQREAANWAAGAERRAEIDAALAGADAHNRAVFAAEANNNRRAETAAEVAKLAGDVESCAIAITTIDARKSEILAAAKLPVVGLDLGEDGIRLAGVPFAQASASEQLRVALALAMAGSPGLDDVWIRDGALLDDESLETVALSAATAGKRVWIERVGTKDPGVIVIQDGEVVGGA